MRPPVKVPNLAPNRQVTPPVTTRAATPAAPVVPTPRGNGPGMRQPVIAPTPASGPPRINGSTMRKVGTVNPNTAPMSAKQMLADVARPSRAGAMRMLNTAAAMRKPGPK